MSGVDLQGTTLQDTTLRDSIDALVGKSGDAALRQGIRDAIAAYLARTAAPDFGPQVACTCLEFAAAAYASSAGDEEAFVRLARAAFALSAGAAREVAGNGEAGHG